MPKSIKQMQVSNPRERSEPARQFEEIFENHHDPAKWAEKKLKDNRIKRAEDIRKNTGL